MSRDTVATALAALVVVLGVVLIVRTISLGTGGGLGLLIGGLLVVGGGLRLYLLKPWRRS